MKFTERLFSRFRPQEPVLTEPEFNPRNLVPLKPGVAEVLIARGIDLNNLPYSNVNLDSPFLNISFWKDVISEAKPIDNLPMWYPSDNEIAEFGLRTETNI